MKEIINKNGLCIYAKGRGFYYSINGEDSIRFTPYKINGIKNQPDIEDIEKLLDSKDRQEILNSIKKIHEEHIDKVCKEIELVKEQIRKEKQLEEEQKQKDKKKKNKQRQIKIPIEFCKDIKELTPDKSIDSINYYTTKINDKEYIIDIIKTSDMKFFIKITDISNNDYKEIDFYEFKKNYVQPSLFDFFDI